MAPTRLTTGRLLLRPTVVSDAGRAFDVQPVGLEAGIAETAILRDTCGHILRNAQPPEILRVREVPESLEIRTNGRAPGLRQRLGVDLLVKRGLCPGYVLYMALRPSAEGGDGLP